ncbi:glycoside hydrolase family 3 protein [Bacillus horti]|uniref:beta-N-acetylhexosaminidase n=1 Tax=Caldalkalibacillus horti TaxID=77523 RepID=A0ABT9VW96_9BACI|nr:glycoside hydrolase family 3 N-terminal domain-containing protein [Bacillus horti]MDQ0165139.1 beta-N-acetylhexosaminidase [Bacillus horti]
MMPAKNKIFVLFLLLCISAVIFLAFVDFTPEPSSLTAEEQQEDSRESSLGEERTNTEDERELKRKERVEAWLQKLTLEEKVGQMFMPQLEMVDGQDTTSMNEALQQKIQQYHLGGVILFEKNIQGVEEVVQLNYQIQEQAVSIPLFISIDQEGGNVRRIPGGTNMPGNMALGATQDRNLAYETGRILGTELHALGVNMNFAPSLDVNNNPSNPVIGLRSFGADPDLVSKLGVSYIQGLQDAQIISTAKHFPGHGDTDVDSHLGLPVVNFDRERLEEIELYPFRQAIEQGVDVVMTAHMTFPRIDNTHYISKKDGSQITIPATLSYKILTELLREELGFKGVIVTDSFLMKAISEHFGEQEAVLKAIQAGVDIILMPGDLEASFHHVVQAVKAGEVTEERIDQSVRRILELKAKYNLLPDVAEAPSQLQGDIQEKLEHALQIIGNEEHRLVEQQVSQQAVTLLKDAEQALPFSPAPDDQLLIIAPSELTAQRLLNELDNLQSGVVQGLPPTTDTAEEGQSFSWQGAAETLIYAGDELPESWVEQLNQAQYVLLATHNLTQMDEDHPLVSRFKEILNTLNEQDKTYMWMALGTPYDILMAQQAKAYMAIYGAQSPNIQAGLNALFGQAEISGQLPVAIPHSLDSSAIEESEEDEKGENEPPLYPSGSGIAVE